MKHTWLLFFVFAVPAAGAGIGLGFEERHPGALMASEMFMRITTLFVVAGIAGGLLSILERSAAESARESSGAGSRGTDVG